MRYSIFFVLFFFSTSVFAASIEPSNNTVLSKSIRQDVQALIQQGKVEVRGVKDRVLNQYFTNLLKEQEQIMKSYLGLSRPADIGRSLTERNALYLSTFKPRYQSILTSIHKGNYSRTIETSKKSEIENTLLSYQEGVVSNIAEQITTHLSQDIFQKGNMNFSYESGSSYVRVRIQDYTLVRSNKDDNQKIGFTLQSYYNMDIPARESCEYDDDWNYICTAGTGTHIQGSISGKIEYTAINGEVYIHIDGFDIVMDMDGVEQKEMTLVIQHVKDILNGKTYHMATGTLESMDSQRANIEKLTQLIHLLREKSIFTPVIRVTDEYVLNLNPAFLEKFNTIFNIKEKYTDYLFPEFRYKNGIFSLNHIDASATSFQAKLAKDADGKSIGNLSIQDNLLSSKRANNLSISLGKDLWDIRFTNADYLSIQSHWDGNTTRTELSGSGVTDMFRSFLSGYTGRSASENSITSLPEKVSIYGGLNSNATSLKFALDDVPFGTLDSFQNGNYTHTRLYLYLFGKKIELTGDATYTYGKYTIEKPNNILEFNTITEESMRKLSESLVPKN